MSTFADVVAALGDPRLSPSAAAGPHEIDDGKRRQTSARPAGAVSARDANDARTGAVALLRTLPRDAPVDLVQDFAVPWSLSLAAAHGGIAPTLAESLASVAREAFIAAAQATRAEPAADASRAVATLASALASALPVDRAPDPLDVQRFVALSQTLPCLLGNVWSALIANPAQCAELRAAPGLIPDALEELLRVAGPSRAVFRRARGTLAIGGATIDAGQRVVLLLSRANHDPERFAESERLDIHRDATGHLAFGRGAHACVGAAMVRGAVRIATEALLGETESIEPAGPVEWLDGFAIRGVTRLPVRLQPRP